MGFEPATTWFASHCTGSPHRVSGVEPGLQRNPGFALPQPNWDQRLPYLQRKHQFWAKRERNKQGLTIQQW